MVRDCCTLAQEFLVLYTFLFFPFLLFVWWRFGSLTAALSWLILLLVLPLLGVIISQIILLLVGPPCINTQNNLWHPQSVPKMCLSHRWDMAYLSWERRIECSSSTLWASPLSLKWILAHSGSECAGGIIFISSSGSTGALFPKAEDSRRLRWCVNSFSLPNSQWSITHHPHFTNEETEAQRG